MNDFNLIKASVNWCGGPRLEINDDRYPVYAVNFNQKIKNKWCSIQEICEFKPFNYHFLNFRFRIQWKIKIWGFHNDLIQLSEFTYSEKNKNIAIILKGDDYEDHKIWLLKSIELSKKYEFIPYIVSKFANRLKKDFSNFSIYIHEYTNDIQNFYSKNQIYASYTIDRKEILTNTADWWETGQIFMNHSRLIKSWDHPCDWNGMNSEQIFNDIMNYE